MGTTGGEMRARLLKLLKVAGYLLFLALLVEAALQTYYYVTAGAFLFSRVAKPLFAPDEHAVYRVRPNLSLEHNTSEFRTMVYTNSQGFRVSEKREEYTVEKGPDTYRILLMGPSYGFGWAVNFEDTFAARLESLLEDHGFSAGREVELINASVPSLEAQRLMNWYRHVGSRYSPDLVIQLLYGSMAVPEPTDVAVNEDGYLVRRNVSTMRKLQAKMKQSAIVFYSWVVYTRLTSSAGQEESGGKVAGAGRELEQIEEFDLDDPRIRYSMGYFEAMAKTVSANGSDLLFVYFPLAYCVHREDISRWKHLGVQDIDRQIDMDRRFCEYLDGHEIPCLNITQDLIRAAEETGERLYYWLDIHWTPQGNLVAAQSVADYLISSAEGSR